MEENLEFLLKNTDFSYFKALLTSAKESSIQELNEINAKLRDTRVNLRGHISRCENILSEAPVLNYDLRFNLSLTLTDRETEMSYEIGIKSVNSELIDLIACHSKTSTFYLTDLICSYDSLSRNFTFLNSFDTRIFVQKVTGTGMSRVDIGSATVEITRNGVSDFASVITFQQVCSFIENEQIYGIREMLSIPVDSVITTNSRLNQIEKEKYKTKDNHIFGYVCNRKTENNMCVFELHSLCELNKVKLYCFNSTANTLLQENMIIKLMNPNLRFSSYNLDLKIDFSASFNTKNIQVVGVMTKSCRERLEDSFAEKVQSARILTLLQGNIVRYSIKIKFRVKKVLKVSVVKQADRLLFKGKIIVVDDTYDAYGFVSGNDLVDLLKISKTYINHLEETLIKDEEECLFKDFDYFLKFKENCRDFDALRTDIFEGIAVPMAKSEKAQDYDTKFQTLMYGDTKNAKRVFLNGTVSNDKESNYLIPRPMLLISKLTSK